MGEIGCLDNGKNLIDFRFSVLFYLIINDLDNCADHFTQIVRGNIGRHTNRNTCGTVYQKVGETAGQYNGLFFRLVKVGCEINRIFVYVRKHFHGNLGKSCLCVTHCRSAIAVHGTEVSVSVNQRIPE